MPASDTGPGSTRGCAGRTRTALGALVLAALPLAVGLTGCGSDDGGGRTATVSNAKPFEVVGDEYSFDPKTLVVETGARDGPAEIDFTLENDGSLAHNLRVERDGRDLGGTATFQGGESRPARLRLAPGKYRMVCTVGNHEELGMVGTLEVRGGERPPTGG